MPEPTTNSTTSSITDPVTGFGIPERWLQLSGDPTAPDKVKSGLWVILSNGRMLRRGLTTGTTAAAASKGAVISLARPVDRIDIMTPAGIRVSLAVRASEGVCTAVKDAGDHEFDITDGLDITARAEPSSIIHLVAGEGIGTIRGRGLSAPEGCPAISQSARRQILRAIEEGCRKAGLEGARVTISVPRGEEIAPGTLNPRIGVVGGISILGSTGFVEPWNEHLADERTGEIRGLPRVVITTGRTGLKYSRVLFPDHKAVLVGSRLQGLSIGEDQESVLCGLPALILKWAWPEILEGTRYSTVAGMVDEDPGHPNIDKGLERVKERLPSTRIVLIDKDGSVLRDVP